MTEETKKKAGRKKRQQSVVPPTITYTLRPKKMKFEPLDIPGILAKYPPTVYPDPVALKKTVDALIEANRSTYDTYADYKTMFSLIDLTSLSPEDTETKAIDICKKVNELKTYYPDLPNVASICVYPTIIEHIANNLKDPSVGIASVSAGFQASQTFLEVKKLETELTIKAGATEIDVVLSLRLFMDGKKEEAFDEIRKIKQVCGDRHLKVILEIAGLKDYNLVREAAILSMESGADFIKTSTGKLEKPKDFESHFYVMCEAIKDFNNIHDRKMGIKPAGGIGTAEEAIRLYTIVSKVLGPEYQSNKLFRIGASKLANTLMTKIFEKAPAAPGPSGAPASAPEAKPTEVPQKPKGPINYF